MALSARVHRVNRAVGFIEAHLFGPLVPTDVSNAVGGSVFELHRLFTDVYGISVAAYVRARRLSEAARMLRSSTLDILEIATRCQYGSQAAFTRAFRRQFEVPPGAWRRGKGRAFATVAPATAAELLHRKGLPRMPALVWRHTDRPLVGTSGELHHEDTAGFLAIAASLARDVPPGTEAVGLARSANTKSLRYFAGIDAPQDAFAEQAVWPAGLYALFEHRGPPESVRHTLSFIVQRWSRAKWMTPGTGPHAEVFRLPIDPTGELELELWIRLEA